MKKKILTCPALPLLESRNALQVKSFRKKILNCRWIPGTRYNASILYDDRIFVSVWTMDTLCTVLGTNIPRVRLCALHHYHEWRYKQSRATPTTACSPLRIPHSRFPLSGSCCMRTPPIFVAISWCTVPHRSNDRHFDFDRLFGFQ